MWVPLTGCAQGYATSCIQQVQSNLSPSHNTSRSVPLLFLPSIEFPFRGIRDITGKPSSIDNFFFQYQISMLSRMVTNRLFTFTLPSFSWCFVFPITGKSILLDFFLEEKKLVTSIFLLSFAGNPNLWLNDNDE